MSELPAPDGNKHPELMAIPASDESTQRLVAAIPVPIRKRDFFRGWLLLAFFHAWGRQDAMAGLIGFAFPVVAKFIPALESAMKDLAWQIPVAVFATVAVMRLILSPYWLFKERSRQAVLSEAQLRGEIEKEKARHGTPVLAGKILCLTEETHRHESEPIGDYGDCWFTMSINIWNDGGAATNVTGFRFLLQWTSSGDDWPAHQVEGLDRFRAKSFRPSDPGLKDPYADEIENLFDFPIPTEITLTNSKRGWLRFVVRGFPLRNGMKLDQDSVITLIALDKKGEPYTIYRGAFSSIGQCPPIEERPMRIKMYTEADGAPRITFEQE